MPSRSGYRLRHVILSHTDGSIHEEPIDVTDGNETEDDQFSIVLIDEHQEKAWKIVTLRR